MLWRFVVSRVEFELIDGRGWSPESEDREARASAEFNDAYAQSEQVVVTAESEEEARSALLRELSRTTGWDVRRAEARLVQCVPQPSKIGSGGDS